MKIAPIIFKYNYANPQNGESIENKFWLPCFSELFEEVTPFFLEDNGYGKDINALQKNILKFAEYNKPDIIFFVLGNDEISFSTLDKLKQRAITLNWFWDDYWRFDLFIKFVTPHLSYAITNDKYSLSKYHKNKINNVIYAPAGGIFFPQNLAFKNIDYLYDISFIGQKNPVREWYIKKLREKGFNVNCFGIGWDNGVISFEQMQNIFFYSKINLNITNSVLYDIRYLFDGLKKLNKSYFGHVLKCKKTVDSVKARNVEIPSCAGFQLSNYTCGIEDYFAIGKEIAVYATLEDLLRQIEYYLQNEDVRLNITKNGYKKAQEYSYYNIFKTIFTRILPEGSLLK